MALAGEGESRFHLVYRWSIAAYVFLILVFRVPLAPPLHQIWPLWAGLAYVCVYNLLLTVGNRQISRALRKYSPLIVVDLVFTMSLLVLTGLWRDPFWLYLFAPIITAAHIHAVAGGLLTAVALIPLYVAGEHLSGYTWSYLLKIGWIDSVFSDSISFVLGGAGLGYHGVTLGRLRSSTEVIARTRDQLESSNRRLLALQAVSVAMQEKRSIEELVETVTEGAAEAIGFDNCAIGLIDETDDTIHGFKSYSRLPEDEPLLETLSGVELRMEAGGGVCSSAVLSRKPIVVSDSTADERLDGKLRAFADQGYSIAVVPILSEKDALGVIAAGRKSTAAPITDEEVELLLAFAAQVGSSVDNARLHEEEQRLLEETKELQELSEAILDNIPAIILFLDRDLRVRKSNRQGRELAGHSHGGGSLVGMGFSELCQGHESGLSGLLAEVLDSGTTVSGGDEFVMTLGDNTYGDVVITPMRDAFGETTGLVMLIYDITETQRLREQSEHAERSYRNLFETASDGMALVDGETGTIIDVNPATERLMGYGRDEMIGMLLNDLNAETGQGGLERETREILEGRRQKIERAHGLTKEGRVILLDITASVVPMDGRPVIFLAARDVTEQDRMQQELLKRNEDLTAVNAVAAAVSESRNVEEISRRALEKIREFTKIDAGAIMLMDEENEELYFVTFVADDARVVQALKQNAKRVKTGKGVAGMASAVGKPVSVENIWAEDAKDCWVSQCFTKDATLVRSGCADFKGFTAVPLLSRNRVIGVINVLTKKARKLDESEISLLMAIGAHIAVALENALLIEKAEDVGAVQERQRLARELHDGLAQSLGTISYHLEAAVGLMPKNSQEAREQILHLQQFAQKSMEEVREYIWDLRSLVLEQSSVDELLSAQLSEFRKIHKMETRYGPGGSLPHVPTRVKRELGLVMQEALRNIVKHAGASLVEVNLTQTDGHLAMEIKDNGRGMRRDQPAGFGLIGMRERADKMGAKLVVSGRRGNGTRVVLTVPVDRVGS